MQDDEAAGNLLAFSAQSSSPPTPASTTNPQESSPITNSLPLVTESIGSSSSAVDGSTASSGNVPNNDEHDSLTGSGSAHIQELDDENESDSSTSDEADTTVEQQNPSFINLESENAPEILPSKEQIDTTERKSTELVTQEPTTDKRKRQGRGRKRKRRPVRSNDPIVSLEVLDHLIDPKGNLSSKRLRTSQEGSEKSQTSSVSSQPKTSSVKQRPNTSAQTTLRPIYKEVSHLQSIKKRPVLSLPSSGHPHLQPNFTLPFLQQLNHPNLNSPPQMTRPIRALQAHLPKPTHDNPLTKPNDRPQNINTQMPTPTHSVMTSSAQVEQQSSSKAPPLPGLSAGLANPMYALGINSDQPVIVPAGAAVPLHLLPNNSFPQFQSPAHHVQLQQKPQKQHPLQQPLQPQRQQQLQHQQAHPNIHIQNSHQHPFPLSQAPPISPTAPAQTTFTKKTLVFNFSPFAPSSPSLREQLIPLALSNNSVPRSQPAPAPAPAPAKSPKENPAHDLEEAHTTATKEIEVRDKAMAMCTKDEEANEGATRSQFCLRVEELSDDSATEGEEEEKEEEKEMECDDDDGDFSILEIVDDQMDEVNQGKDESIVSPSTDPLSQMQQQQQPIDKPSRHEGRIEQPNIKIWEVEELEDDSMIKKEICSEEEKQSVLEINERSVNNTHSHKNDLSDNSQAGKMDEARKSLKKSGDGGLQQQVHLEPQSQQHGPTPMEIEVSRDKQISRTGPVNASTIVWICCPTIFSAFSLPLFLLLCVCSLLW